MLTFFRRNPARLSLTCLLLLAAVSAYTLGLHRHAQDQLKNENPLVQHAVIGKQAALLSASGLDTGKSAGKRVTIFIHHAATAKESALLPKKTYFDTNKVYNWLLLLFTARLYQKDYA